MTEFNVKLAGISIGIKSLFAETLDFCRDYITEEIPQLTVEITPEDILSERERNTRQMALEGHKQKNFSDKYMETLALYRKITAKLIDYDVLLFHGCVMAADGKAYLFTAKSGTGKTTHCNLWLKNIPDCHILNGDKPLLLFKENEIYACGTPWMGKEKFGTNEILPLKAICLLERAEKNNIEKIPFSQAYTMFLTQTHKPDTGNALIKVVKLLQKFNNVGIYRLGCNMDTEAAFVSYNEMVK